MKQLVLLAASFLFVNTSSAQGTCETALPVTEGITAVGPITGTPNNPICIGGLGSAAMWYTYTATADTTMILLSHVQGIPDTDTKVSLYSGTCGALTCLTGDDDSGYQFTSMIIFPVTEGTAYTFAFDNSFSSGGFSFDLHHLIVTPITFTPVTIDGADGIQGAVDMNNDGRDDAVMPGSISFNIGFQGDLGAYTVTNYPTTPATNIASWSFAVGDWDSNGYRDLLYGGGSGATFMNASADGLSYTQNTFPQYIFCQRTNFVDLNNDGHLDAFSCHDVDANVGFINDGNGNLVFTQGGYGTTCGNYGSIFTDLNNDGAMDLFVAKCGCDPQDLLMPNDGNGVFTNVAPSLGLADGHQSWSSAWGDLDNDGDMDGLIGSSGPGVHKLMRNNNDGTFTDVTIGSGMDTFTGSSIEWTAHDFNNDGWIDILGGGALHYNNGDMTFSHDVNTPGNGPVGDMNADGFLDLLNGSGYMANDGNDNNYIRINLVGTVSNRDAIGARVTVTSALGTQIRDIRSGDGFHYMSFIGAHFGLGNDTQVDQVQVRWPSGAVDVITDLTLNSTHTIVEGVANSVGSLAEATFAVAPNPATDVVFVSGVPPNAMVEVADATGKRVMNERLLGNDLGVGGLAPGVYLLRVSTAQGVLTSKFIKR
ncbi:MAG: FG-GAP-like repeat-containing protein [Flavobacteriales bacterium]